MYPAGQILVHITQVEGNVSRLFARREASYEPSESSKF
jgi:hypothetical protein